MSSDTLGNLDILFLEKYSTVEYEPNFATATADAIFSDYSHTASGSITGVEFDVSVKGGVAAALAEAESIFINDPGFSTILTDVGGFGIDGSYEINAASQVSLVAQFEVKHNKKFSFDFTTNIALATKEIEYDNAEYNKAISRNTFLVLATDHKGKTKLADFFTIGGSIISAQKIGKKDVGVGNLDIHGSSNRIKITNKFVEGDVSGQSSEDLDFVNGTVSGTYKGKFQYGSTITLVQINTSAVELLGDDLIGNLGNHVHYGTIGNDNLKGSRYADQIYASLGHDYIDGKGGDDILEGGKGHDVIKGGYGDDKIHGSYGNDVIEGGKGHDLLVGGEDYDHFVFERNRHTKDTILDFKVGEDKIVFKGKGLKKYHKFDKLFLGMTNTSHDGIDGTLINLDYHQEIFLAHVDKYDLSKHDFVFA